MTEVTAFTISRKEWLRGEGHKRSRLLRPSDGKRCCVGIYARACGVPDTALENAGWPGVAAPTEKPCRWACWSLPANHWLHERFASSVSELLSTINDERLYDESTRESLIAARFAEHGITVTFTD